MDPCIQKERLDKMELKYIEIQEDIREIKDDIKTIMDVLIPKLNPKQGMVARMDMIEADLRKLQVDLIERRNTSRVASIMWSIISSSLVTAIIMAIVGFLMRAQHV